MLRSELPENETYSSCLQSSILSQGTLARLPRVPYLSWSGHHYLVYFRIPPLPCPTFKKNGVGEEKEKGDTPSFSNSDFVAHMLQSDDFMQLPPLQKLPRRLTRCTFSLQDTTSVCCRDSVVSTLTDPACVRLCVVCILARKCRQAKIVLRFLNSGSLVMWGWASVETTGNIISLLFSSLTLHPWTIMSYFS